MWILSVCFNFSDALCPMECRATEDLSESDVLLVEKQVNMRRQRLSAAFVLCLTQTLDAMIFVSQGQSDSFCKSDNDWILLIVYIWHQYIKLIISEGINWVSWLGMKNASSSKKNDAKHGQFGVWINCLHTITDLS